MARSWVKARKHDPYYRAAKRTAHRSRAAFKLMQIQRRFAVVRKGDTVVDLGAAPGGWSQVAARLAGPGGRVFAVDVVSVAPIDGVTVVRGDLTDPELMARLLTALGTPADVVLSDASPKLSGVRSVDQARALELSLASLALAAKALCRGGRFVVKSFRGSDHADLVRALSSAFERVKEYRPPASPAGSAEVYLVGLGKR